MAHGVDTTVVEIDPVVHEFASKYFQLPSNHTPVIEDAVTYTGDLVNKTTDQFDYIVHDVFTGGAEPIALFTLEFLQNLYALLKPNGVVAIVCCMRLVLCSILYADLVPELRRRFRPSTAQDHCPYHQTGLPFLSSLS